MFNEQRVHDPNLINRLGPFLIKVLMGNWPRLVSDDLNLTNLRVNTEEIMGDMKDRELGSDKP